MRDVLLNVAEEIVHIDMERNAIMNGNRILSAIVIMCCLNEMIPKCIKFDDITDHRISALLSMLCLMPDTQSRKCADWDYLTNLIPTSFRKTAYESVLAFINHLSHTKCFDLPEWLFAVPIVHFLKEDCVPFEDMVLDPKKIPWIDKLIGLQGVRSEASGKKCCL